MSLSVSYNIYVTKQPVRYSKVTLNNYSSKIFSDFTSLVIEQKFEYRILSSNTVILSVFIRKDISRKREYIKSKVSTKKTFGVIFYVIMYKYWHKHKNCISLVS